MERFQTCIHDKARATSYYMAEDKESVFIALFLLRMLMVKLKFNKHLRVYIL